MTTLSQALVAQCRAKLQETKARLLNQLRDQRLHLSTRQVSGDEGDLSLQALDENQLYVKNQRVKEQLLEVELALARIERGNFGICEETQELIEPERLIALPWTRLSIEGAEIREVENSRHSS